MLFNSNVGLSTVRLTEKASQQEIHDEQTENCPSVRKRLLALMHWIVVTDALHLLRSCHKFWGRMFFKKHFHSPRIGLGECQPSTSVVSTVKSHQNAASERPPRQSAPKASSMQGLSQEGHLVKEKHHRKHSRLINCDKPLKEVVGRTAFLLCLSWCQQQQRFKTNSSKSTA